MANTRRPAWLARRFASSLYCPGKLLWTNRTSVIATAGPDERVKREQLAVVQLGVGFELDLRSLMGFDLGRSVGFGCDRDRSRHQPLREQAGRHQVDRQKI